GTTDLGCNPANIPACDPGVSAHNECGSVAVTCAVSDSSDGCAHSRTITYTASACGFTSTCERVYTWTQTTAPVIANCPTGGDLGCNPAALPSCSTALTPSDSRVTCGV